MAATSPTTPPPILVVDPDDDQLHAAERALSTLGVGPVATLRDRSQVRPYLARNACVLVMLNVARAGGDAADLVGHIVCAHPALSVVVTGANDVAEAVACIRRGATDYLPRPCPPERLIASARRALGLERTRVRESAPDGAQVPGVVAASQAMRGALDYALACASSPLPLLITGEPGTGKELLARTVHQAAGRGDFLALAGGDTGPDAMRAALADRIGTVYIDEVAALPAAAQATLARRLRDAEAGTRGGLRVIAGTARDQRGGTTTIVDELWHVLRAHHAHLPPLRARRDDVAPLLDHFLAQAARELGRARPAVPPAVLDLLAQYPFPGNARELRALVYESLLHAADGTVGIEPFARAIEAAGTTGGQDAARRLLGSLPQLPNLKEIQALLVEEALRRTSNHQAAAAELLGVTRQALNKRLRGRRRA